MWTRLSPLLLLTVLTLLFFGPLVVHPDQLLYSDTSDILGLHLPAKHFLVRSWHETGELPLWCPYSFGGEPFIEDIQVASYYPAHLFLLLLPEDWVGPALSWIVVLHVLLAGWTMYAYSRDEGLGTVASLVAAFGYMFAGKWLLQVLAAGHYIVIGLAWLPLVLLCLGRAVRCGSLAWATAAGACFGLIVMVTQPQWTFYAGLLTALWTLGTALQAEGPRRGLARCVGYGGWTVLLAVGVAAVTFLPGLEGARYATRSAGVVDLADAEGGGLRALLFLVGPALTTAHKTLQWEDRGGLTLVWLLAAALAVVLCPSQLTRYRGLILLGVLLFAFGGSLLFQPLPGFRLFRQPARMTLLAAFPTAFLAGVTTQRLFGAGAALDARLLARCRLVFVLLLAGLLLLTGMGFKAVRDAEAELAFHYYWVTLLLTVPLAFWLLTPAAPRALSARVLLWTGVLVLDLWTLVWPLVAVRPEAEIYDPSACVRYLMEHDAGHARILDHYEPDVRPNVPSSATPLGLGAPLAMIYRLEALRGYNPLDVLRYKEYLQFLGDKDEPLRPFTSQLSYPVMGEFPIKNRPLLDLLGVRYVLRPQSMPPETDGWRQLEVDPHPQVYDFSEGMIPLVPYVVWENETVMPRAFVVHEAAPLPDRPEVLSALKKTNLRRTVLLEDVAGTKSSWPALPVGSAAGRQVTIRSYRPNEVVLDVAEGPAGYLVLADVWFPGWTCTVGRIESPVYRADFLFRAVEVPAGAHEVVFRFRPQPYYLGRWISGVTVLVIAVVLLFGGLRQGEGFRA